MTSLESKIYTFVAQIPKGKVSTYKQVALVAGTHPRIVGRILHHNDDPKHVPCHRIIKSDGTIASGFAFGGPGAQQSLLEAEGVVFAQNGVIDLEKFGYFIY
jgi:methylated-DNA-protein-cysteine methyltransferase related protein